VLLIGMNRENGRLCTRAQDKMGELEAMYVVSWELIGRGTMEGLAQGFADALTEHLQASHSAVFLYEQDQDSLRLAAVSGEDMPFASGKAYPIAQERRPGFHSGHTAKAFRENRVVVVPSIFADVEFLPWQLLAKHEGMIVSVPMSDVEGTLGVYNLFFPGQEKIPEEKLRLYQTIAASAGAAIRHAQTKQVSDPLPEAQHAA
jgi:GAF domain-containing protein